MNTDSSPFEKTAEQWAAFQKIWGDTFTRMIQAGFTFSPEAAPPEFLRQIRSGIFQALSQSWEEFLRSPEFLEGTKQWMENATTFRKMTTEFLTKAQHEAQSPGREDVDDILLSVRQVENRILDRLEELEKQITANKPEREKKPAAKSARPGNSRRPVKKAKNKRG